MNWDEKNKDCRILVEASGGRREIARIAEIAQRIDD
jgi:hypothetical protein